MASPETATTTTRTGEGALGAANLAKRFGDREALRGVTFEVYSGERAAIIGPNGAGKTTLLSIMAGIPQSSRGFGITAPGGPPRGGGGPPPAARFHQTPGAPKPCPLPRPAR